MIINGLFVNPFLNNKVGFVCIRSLKQKHNVQILNNF